MRVLPLALAALSLLVTSGAKAAPPVSVALEGLLGEAALTPSRTNPIRVELTNRTGRAVRGVLELRSRIWGQRAVPHVLDVHLPPRAKRALVLTLPVLESGSSIEAAFLVKGRKVAGDALYLGYGSAPVVVVLADPPRILGTLLSVATPAVSASAAPRDETTGDPVLPVQAAGWAPVSLLVVSGPMLSRLASEAERSAIADWIHAGGEMLLFPRTDADLSDPFLVSLIGEVHLCEGEADAGNRFVPAGAPSCVEGGERLVRDVYGGAVQVGFGRVDVAGFDGMAQPFVDRLETEQLIRTLAARERIAGEELPVLPPGRDLTAPDVGMTFFGPSAFQSLRPVLDPNEAFRPALAFVALLLFAYVIVVGPLNFKMVARRKRPTLALVTTPVMALSCMMLLFGVGWVAKGVNMRHRTVELVELPADSSFGTTRRFRGLFLTHPTSLDLPFPEDGLLTLLGTGGSRIGRVDRNQAVPVLRDVRGRLWDTLFAREDCWVTVEGNVHLELEGGRVVAVENRLKEPLLGALVVYPTGKAHAVGEVAPGTRATVDSVPRFDVNTPIHPRYLGNGEWKALSDHLGLDVPEALEGLTAMGDHMMGSRSQVVLFARLRAPKASFFVGRFRQEMNVRLLRVVQPLPYVPVDQVEIPEENLEKAPWEPFRPDAGADGGADAGEGVVADRGAGGGALFEEDGP